MKQSILFEEYKIICEGCDRYFDYLYRKISVSVVFFTTTILYALNKETAYLAKELLFLYIIPIFGYLFGLLYCYDISAIAKQGYHIVCLEKRLKKIHSKFISYVSDNKKFTKGYILSYGTSIMFYLAMPIISIVVGFGQMTALDNKELFFSKYEIAKDIVLYVMPIMFYIIYIVFCIIVFYEIHTLMRNTRKIIKK